MDASRARVTRGIGGLVLIGMLMFSPAGLSAQSGDMDPTAYLYRTSCADAASSRNAVEIAELEDDRITLRRVWSEIGTGGDRPNGMYGEIEDIDHVGNVQTLIDGDFSLVIHQDDSRRSAILACVDIEGTVAADGSLMVQINTVDDSGYDGRALIRPEDDDDDEIEFVIGIFPAGVVEPVAPATPAA